MSERVSTSSAPISACSGLMYSNVPTIMPNWVNIVFSVRRRSIALATPKSITLGTGVPSESVTRMLEGLTSRLDDPFLVGVLDRLAHWDKQLEAFERREPVAVAVLGDRDALDELHDEVGVSGFGRPRVHDLGDIRVVHQGQSLA